MLILCDMAYLLHTSAGWHFLKFQANDMSIDVWNLRAMGVEIETLKLSDFKCFFGLDWIYIIKTSVSYFKYMYIIS